MTTPIEALIPPGVEAILDRQFQLLIGGSLVPALSGASYPDMSPVTGAVIAQIPDGGEADVTAAVAAAETARKDWRRIVPAQRGALVREFADVIEKNSEELALLDAIDAGIPIGNARADVALAVASMRMFASFALEMKGTTIPASNNIHMTVREPIGIVARIVAFNHPLMFACKIAAPLVAGNCVLLKAPDEAPL
ncbi:MAG: hypothetical protein QOH40_863, partial [Arthrobacter pascens]|nr:hypothetical protein [Arthrobacter pascens]